jgi:LuxR family maltose regulon positive regulatory protein
VVSADEQTLLAIHPCAQDRSEGCANDAEWTTPSSASLSPRERGILLLVTQGLSNKEIARRLCIGPETVKSHLKSVFWKLTVRTRAEAAYRALVLRLV